MKLRSAMSAAAALPLALGLAACGSDQPEATGYKPSAPASIPAATPTTAAVPQKVAPAAHLDRVTFVPAMNTALTKQKSWRVVGTMTANGSTLLTMDGVQTADPVALEMEMTGAAFEGKTAKIIVIKDIGYASIPGMTPAGKYARIDADDAPELRELLEGGDPTKIYKSFEGAVRSVEFVGTEPVGRQLLDRYDVTVDTAKALTAQGKKVPAGVPKTLTYSMWLDKSHLVRRLEFNLMGMSMEMTMSDYNKRVTITAPPASKIVR
ncbi:hypothetical protein E1218_06250 [Kribbella turkmenica]|uniref:LppX_LprAFG lipoprotein n=1 Tax=Kribbella turkmenica TaxID=2530375 RepID=A0A4R4XDF2_9ACTN|nr:hypothetical protein [Kribbella turkmenica]TDD28713.1 hypothetical protein E1218_06250 [Kribbella turkmenica]